MLMLSIIYNVCISIIIMINIIIIAITAYYLYVLRNKYITITNKKKVFTIINKLKNDIINDYNNYSSTELDEIINDIIQIYIDNKCDFDEDYENNIKIHYKDINDFIINKRTKLYNDIINKNNNNLSISII